MDWVPSVVWLVLLVVFAIAEAATVGLVSVWFAAGALVALLSTFFTGNIWVQIFIFLLVSAVTLALVRPLTKKYLTPKQIATNVDRLIGRTGVVSEEICDLRGSGAVRIAGVEWTARTGTDGVIPAGSIVKVLRIEGVKLIVAPAEERKEL